MFSFQRLKGLISFGWKLLASALLDTVYLKLYQLVVGLKYTASDLAFFNKGDQLCILVVENINASIDSVLLPVLSSEQDNREHVREMTRRAIKTSSYIMMPIMMGMAVCAEPLIRLLLTEKWLPAVPYMQVFCAVYAFYPLHTANLNAIKAMGRSDIFLKQEILKKILITLVILATMGISAYAIALGEIFSGLASLLINAWPNRKLLGLSYKTQLRDMLPAILASAAMGIVVWPVQLLGFGDFVTLLIQVPLGVAAYVAISAIFRIDSFGFMLEVLKKLLRRRKAEN